MWVLLQTLSTLVNLPFVEIRQISRFTTLSYFVAILDTVEEKTEKNMSKQLTIILLVFYTSSPQTRLKATLGMGLQEEELFNEKRIQGS